MAVSLLDARKNAGIKQKFVAEFLGVTAGTVCRWEKGQSIPKYGYVRLMAKMYGIEPADIFLPNR